MGNIVNLERWRRRPVSRYGRRLLPTSLSSLWFKKHGPFRARVNKMGALVLEHDEIGSIPHSVIMDLLRAEIFYYGESDWLETYHPFRSWLAKGEPILKFVDRTSFGQKVPLGAIQIGIFVDGDVPICFISHINDERKKSVQAKSYSGG